MQISHYQLFTIKIFKTVFLAYYLKLKNCWRHEPTPLTKIKLAIINVYTMSGFNLHAKRHRSFLGTLMFLLLSAFNLMAQAPGSENVGIGTTTPNKSALLDLSSTTKGLLIPRMTLAQRGNIVSPATGLMIYQTDFLAGFYYFDGSEWKSLSASNIGKSLRTDASINDATWGTNGNAGTNSDFHFLGTTDTTSLAFKVNNFRSGFLDYRFGNTYFGYRAGYRSQGFNSVAIGAYALHEASSGLNNVAIGYQALPNNQTGSDNIAIGMSSLFYNNIGSQNIAIGTQAGQKSTGDGNIFIGNNSGANETGNNKLYIENGTSNDPLIYGDLARGYLGINTRQAGSALTIDSKVENLSGIQFKRLTSNSPAGRPNQKVLSVDEEGRVILVRDSIGFGNVITTMPSANYWAAKGNAIENTNAGDVVVSNIRFKNLRSTSPANRSNMKVLSVDENGLLVLVKDSVGTGGNQVTEINGFWESNNGVLSNLYENETVELKGNVRLKNLTAYSQAYTPYGKVLTVTDDGRLILVRDSVGTGGSGGPSYWNVSGNTISNNNSGIVQINTGIRLPQLTSATPASTTSQKFLSVDEQGNIILANSNSTGGGGSSDINWTLSGNNVSNNNTGLVSINNSLNVKNGIKIETGRLTFSELTSNSAASRSNGKVLSVDNAGNLILVRDSVAVVNNPGGIPVIPSTEPSQWAVNDNNISNKNTGNVYISNGLVLSKLSSEAPTSITSTKVLSVDVNGQVILVNAPTSTTGGGGIGNSLWKNNDNGIGIVNNNSGGIFINSDENNKSGLKFNRLNSGSPAGNAYGKVLSVDDSGNVILVNDGGGNGGGGSSNWNLVDGRLQNANNGKVVIGTGINSFPDAFNLFVKGGILTERLRVALANSDRWADYVFQPDYKLMPLHDVERFIKHNQHLPNVPSAEEMAKNGIDMAETSAKLMEKIEELTLYLIEADKKIKELEKKVAGLEKTQK